MLPDQKRIDQGYISILLIVFLLLLAIFLYPKVSPQKISTVECQAGVAPKAEIIKDFPTLFDSDGSVPFEEQPTDKFRLIRQNVPVSSFLTVFHPEAWSGSSGVAVHMIGVMYLNENERLMYPKKNFGEHTIERTSSGQQKGIHLWGEGLVFVMHMQGPSTPVEYAFRPASAELSDTGIGSEVIRIVDVYQQIDRYTKVMENQSGYTHEELFQCDEGGPLTEQMTSAKPNVIIPFQNESANAKQLQLEWLLFENQQGVWGTHCKPAIYLYPKQKQFINVKVKTKGRLIYTDPVYDDHTGWKVIADPSGKLENLGNSYNSKGKLVHPNGIFPYLYYESQIPDSLIHKPAKGWVIQTSEIEPFFEDLLPKLGLNPIQKTDFIEYWQKALTDSSYLFVGLLSQENINQIEPLEITPKPDSINRVRIYFERLDQPKLVETPTVTRYQIPVTSNQFKVVEWGGMVKNDPSHPFTCSQ